MNDKNVYISFICHLQVVSHGTIACMNRAGCVFYFILGRPKPDWASVLVSTHGLFLGFLKAQDRPQKIEPDPNPIKVGPTPLYGWARFCITYLFNFLSECQCDWIFYFFPLCSLRKIKRCRVLSLWTLKKMKQNRIAPSLKKIETKITFVT